MKNAKKGQYLKRVLKDNFAKHFSCYLSQNGGQSAVCKNSFTVSHSVSGRVLTTHQPNSSQLQHKRGGLVPHCLLVVLPEWAGPSASSASGKLWSVGQSRRSSSTRLIVLLRPSWTGFVFDPLQLSGRFLFRVVASPSVKKSAGAC